MALNAAGGAQWTEAPGGAPDLKRGIFVASGTRVTLATSGTEAGWYTLDAASGNYVWTTDPAKPRDGRVLLDGDRYELYGG